MAFVRYMEKEIRLKTYPKEDLRTLELDAKIFTENGNPYKEKNKYKKTCYSEKWSN
jgi:hypothetical protein